MSSVIAGIIVGASALAGSMINAHQQSKASERQAEGQRRALEQQKKVALQNEQETNRANKQQVGFVNQNMPTGDYGNLTGGTGIQTGDLNLGSAPSLSSNSPLNAVAQLAKKQKVK